MTPTKEHNSSTIEFKDIEIHKILEDLKIYLKNVYSPQIA